MFKRIKKVYKGSKAEGIAGLKKALSLLTSLDLLNESPVGCIKIKDIK